MSKYAILRVSGHQYKVEEGKEILVNRLTDKKLEPEVLLVVDGEKVEVGTPLVKGGPVKVKVLDEVKGEKIHVMKYKSKSRYKKHTGFRPVYTKLLVEKIG